jgi:isopenicillin N synthase-like dioxygenase
MSTSFSSLPIVSLEALYSKSPSQEQLNVLSSRLDEVFSTTGFAYLTRVPLTYSHAEVFDICDSFFGPDGLSNEEKMKLAKKTFATSNNNTYRGCDDRLKP